jgi:tRNA (Thr-GGU) A37 N-methylase
MDTANYAEFRVGNGILSLATADEKNPLSSGGQVAYWRVREIGPSIAHFTANGGKIFRGPLDIEDGEAICQIQDPFGNVLGLIGEKIAITSKREEPSIHSVAIGKVVSDRTEIIDDNWDSVQSFILLDESKFSPEALFGLDSFSHAEVLFYLDQVDVRKVETGARHPRGNKDWPKIGIFAQRGKNRPNRLAHTICRILKIDGLKVYLEGLDAVDGSPVLDIKPWVEEFGPRGATFQPAWMTELMREYWTVGDRKS